MGFPVCNKVEKHDTNNQEVLGNLLAADKQYALLKAKNYGERVCNT